MKARDGLFIIIIIGLVAYLLHTCDRAKRVEYNLHAEQEKAIFWKDNQGRSNAELGVLRQDYQTYILKNESVVDSLKALKIKPKNVTKIETLVTETRDTIYLSKQTPLFSNKWSTFALLDSNRVAYKIRDSLALITHTKHYGFLNLKTKYVTRAISFNPQTAITGLTSVEIIPRVRRLSLCMYAGYGIQLSGGIVRVGPSAGIGVTFRIF